jgi:hypothetical protein
VSDEGKKKLKKIIGDAAADADQVADDDVLDSWGTLGKRLQADDPTAFRERYKYLLSAFRDRPDKVLDATVENWIRLGTKIITMPGGKRVMVKLILTHDLADHLGRDREGN